MDKFQRDMLFLLTIASITAMIGFALGTGSVANLLTPNSTTPTNYTTMPSNSIKIGNCIFPLKLYNNMTAPQIENATLICYK
jgi:hypothetical protein